MSETGTGTRLADALERGVVSEALAMRCNYFEPASVEEATEILRRGRGRHKVLAGGTDVILQLRRRAKSYDGLVNIKRLPGITDWTAEPGDGLHVGAATPFRRLETSPTVSARFPALVEAIRAIGSVQLRNTATVGGNLCNASPAADSAPPLIAAGATATFFDDRSGIRTIPVERFFAGPGLSVLGPEGILLRVDVPEPRGMTGDRFERFAARGAMDIAIASAASRVVLDPSTGNIVDVAIALGAVAPTPMRARKTEDALIGREPTPESLAKAGAIAKDECSPISDIRASASYRREIIEVLVRRALERAIERAGRRSRG